MSLIITANDLKSDPDASVFFLTFRIFSLTFLAHYVRKEKKGRRALAEQQSGRTN